MRFALCIVLSCIGMTTFAQMHSRTDTIGVRSTTDNLYNKKLFGDSLASSFYIVIHREVKAHRHLAHSEHVVVMEGEGEMRLGDSVFVIRPQDVIFIPKNTVHSAKRKGNVPLKVLSIQAPHFDGKDRVMTEK
jgi:mannose-6-phosphate isomerase-like protein (cupin superfamily)